MGKMDELLYAMMEYDKGDPKRIQHLVKVHEFARLIGLAEGLDAAAMEILEAASIVHDIGIHKAEEKYGRNTGKYQEIEGPAEAETLMRGLSWPEPVVERVSWLVGHHHTYEQIEGMDYQILVEADFLVNLLESHATEDTRQETYRRIFKTEGGKRLFSILFEAPDAGR